MKVFLRMLNLVGKILSSFNGATAVTLGDVTLLVKGKASHLVSFVLNR